jgi:uncharacterized radical SAM superfamily Fe-S cluster-containing enzyme
MIEITGSCSLECPICYASCKADRTLHKPEADILSLGEKIRADGGRFVQLIGGEPAEHPQLLDIVRKLRTMGLRPLMATNGLRLAEDPHFATALKKSGLYKVNIQFDTLRSQTSMILRGKDLIRKKRKAVESAHQARLRIGLIGTMCKSNVDEAGDILRFARPFMPLLNTITLQMLIQSGRSDSTVLPVTRSEAFAHLFESETEYAFSASDIMPPPQYPSWKALTHPSCASMLYLCHDGASGNGWLLNRDVDLEKLYHILHDSNTRGSGILDTLLRPACALWRTTRKGARRATLQRMASLLTGRGRKGLCVVYVDGLMDRTNLDPERMRRCPACFATEKGFRNPCALYAGEPNHGMTE